MNDVAAEVLPAQVQQALKEQWIWRCAGCGHILFKMAGSVIQLKCTCNTMNTLTIK